MTKIIKNVTYLSDGEIEELTRVFRNDRYRITSSLPDPDNDPELFLDRQKDAVSYQTIFRDLDAHCRYFSIQYETAGGESVLIPFGIYGVSNQHKMHFPLFIDDFWHSLLGVNKTDFGAMSHITDAAACDLYYSKLLELRKEFLRNIFEFYFSLDLTYYTAMVWKIKGKQSLTRTTAESLGFYRVEHGEHEVYSSIEIDPEKWEYIKECLERKGRAIGDHSKGRRDLFNDKFNARFFARGLVNY